MVFGYPCFWSLLVATWGSEGFPPAHPIVMGASFFFSFFPPLRLPYKYWMLATPHSGDVDWGAPIFLLRLKTPEIPG